MLSLTSNHQPCTFVGMVDLNELELRQRREYAAAVRAIRTSKGWTQQQAADVGGMTLQAWANYERAERPFKKTLIATVCRVLGITPEELELKRAELAPPEAPQPRETAGFSERAGAGFELTMETAARFGPDGFEILASLRPETIDLSSFFGPDWRVLQLPGEEMAPYADPGGFVTYNIRRAPQPGKGCVVMMRDGRYLVRRYEGMKDGNLVVTRLHPVEQQAALALTDVAGVFPIGLRMD